MLALEPPVFSTVTTQLCAPGPELRTIIDEFPVLKPPPIATLVPGHVAVAVPVACPPTAMEPLDAVA